MTLVLWLAVLSGGLIGLAVPYTRPRFEPPMPQVAGLELEPLDVEFAGGAQGPAGRSVAQEQPPSLPPPLPELTLSEFAPALIELAEPVAVGAFPEPVAVEQPVAARESGEPEVASPAPGSLPKPAPSPPTKLVYGRGEGRQPAPAYPPRAQREGQEGTVVVRFVVGRDGRVLSAEAARRSAWPLLDESAIKTVRRSWRFPPGEPRLYEVRIRFELNEGPGL